MDISNLVGATAAIASTASFVPQAYKVIRSRETRDISIGMYALTVAAFGLWIGFGVLHREWPLIVSNAICFFVSGFILVMSLLPQPKKEAVADALLPDAGENR